MKTVCLCHMHQAVLPCAHCYVIIWYLAVHSVFCGAIFLVMFGIPVGACLCCSWLTGTRDLDSVG